MISRGVKSRWDTHNFMELMQEKGYSDHSREEEEELQDEEEELLAETSNKESSSKQQHQQYYPFSSSSSPSNLWLGMLHPHHPLQSPEATTCESHNSSSSSGLLGLHRQDYAPSNSNSTRKQLNLMDLSLGNKDDVVEEASNFHQNANSSVNNDPIQKEHMFDKVVTPSDVGKLNRLVIPKQHAERFFPLDSSTNDKGLLLNFEDRTGKLWRFRYSYWNSSQSYVMTKGWSRFVKEKKLDAGDIVSFERGMGELHRHKLYIDWRCRPDHAAHAGVGVAGLDHHHHLRHHHHSAALITPLLLPSSQYSVRWGGRLYPLPAQATPANYHQSYPFQQPQHQLYGGSHHGSYNNELNLGSGSLYYYRSMALGDRNLQEGGSNVAPMIIDSVPVAHGNSGSGGGNASDSAGKRLRLFGVNMECSSSSSSASSSLPSNVQYLRETHEEEEEEDHQKGETSVLFDLNPSSFQHRQY